jgi:pyridoxamine 5'-phosphate oxidase
MHQSSIADIRRDYKLQSFLETDAAANPIEQFTKWWQEAINSNIDEVNAMTLATCTTDGKPSARTVLLKDYNEDGFVFFTNYNSHKGKEINENPRAALVFFWKELERQIRIEGTVQKIDDAKSDAYFLSRPRGSKIGAWSSPQSEVIANRTILETHEERFKKEFGENIPRPLHWGGYIVQPTVIEFWQGRSSRLHDRLQYRLDANKNWIIERLAP